MEQKRERGDGGGIIYAMVWFSILFAWMIYAFNQFNCNIYIAKAEMEIGLHIVEGAVMTSTQRVDVYTDDFERDLSRAHIVTSGIKRDSTTPSGSIKELPSSPGDTMSWEETKQCLEIGNRITKELQSQFQLDAGNVPQGGGVSLLSSGRKAGTTLLIDGVARIYEPVYSYTVVRTPTGNPEKPYEFTESGSITGWMEYDLYFNQNAYDHASKRMLSGTPSLKSGSSCEGATIEMTVKTTFYGVNRIFSEVSEATTYNREVSVTQATDIVHVSLDSRKK